MYRYSWPFAATRFSLPLRRSRFGTHRSALARSLSTRISGRRRELLLPYLYCCRQATRRALMKQRTRSRGTRAQVRLVGSQKRSVERWGAASLTIRALAGSPARGVSRSSTSWARMTFTPTTRPSCTPTRVTRTSPGSIKVGGGPRRKHQRATTRTATRRLLPPICNAIAM